MATSSIEENTVYFLFDAIERKKIPVCFSVLTEADRPALESEDWRTARFLDVWKESVGHDIVLKLTLCDELESPILGIVRLGTIERRNGKPDVLRDSLLETAPVYRHSTVGRRYHGIGQVLVARLIMESNKRGANGRVMVRPARGSLNFYEKLGFVPAPILHHYVIEAKSANELLQICRNAPEITHNQGD